MWHFILPFTDKHHADCHLRKLSRLWKSEDVGMIILIRDESSLCCWCVIRKKYPGKKNLTNQVLLVNIMVIMARLAPNHYFCENQLGQTLYLISML